MAHHARDPNLSSIFSTASNERAQHRRERLRHIHPMTREQQVALIDEARAARQAEHSGRVSAPVDEGELERPEHND
jgi:hypothetical protein